MLHRLRAESPLNLISQQVCANLCLRACHDYCVCALLSDKYSARFTHRDQALLATLQGCDYLCNTLSD